MENNLSIFIATHKLFNEYIYPMNDMYTIISQTDLDFDHNTISLSNDEFTKNFASFYGEGCAMHYLYEHQELIKDYIIFYQYRRYFPELINNESKIIEYIDKYGCINVLPEIYQLNNLFIFKHQINNGVVLIWLNIMKKNYPEYTDIVDDWASTRYFNNYNVFGMKKENFIEMCSFIFDVCQKLCEYFNVQKTEDIFKANIISMQFPLDRMIGFFIEQMTHIYYKYHFKNAKSIYYNFYCSKFADINFNTTVMYYPTSDITSKWKNQYDKLNFSKYYSINDNENVMIENLDTEYIFICNSNNLLYFDNYVNISHFIINELINKNYKSLTILGDNGEQCILYEVDKKTNKKLITLNDYINQPAEHICDKSIAKILNI